MGRRVLLSLAVLAVGTGLFAATGLGRPVQKQGGTLRISSAHDVDSLDPAIAYGTDSWMIEFTTCARLYSYPDKSGPEGAVLIPEVAAGMPTLSKDRKTQTIELKRTYRFDTGARITAANFVAAFNRDAGPIAPLVASTDGKPLSSAATNFMHEVVGADAAIDGRARSISGVRALSPYTLQIRTTRPIPDLVSRLTLPFFCPIPVGLPPRETDSPPGSGPYRVASHVANRQIVLERNPSYRGPRPAHVDRIVWTFAAPTTCGEQLERNQQDYCLFPPPGDKQQQVAQLGINRPNGRLFYNTTLSMFYFAFNHDRQAFKGAGQIPLKKAINLVLDRPALARAAGYLSGRRVDQMLPGRLGRDEHIYPLRGVSTQDLARARALVAQAKYKPDKLILYTHVPGFKGVNAIWAQTFRYDVGRLGIDVEIRYFNGPAAVVLTPAGTRGEQFDVVISAWTPDYFDGVAFFGPLLDGNNIKLTGNYNFSYFDRPKVNREIERIEGLTGEARRMAWADLDVDLMRNDPPWAPFLGGTEVDIVSRSFGCYVFQPVFSSPDLAAACKK
jgi:ABC-type oligopeptide transport system substrate-binding subunit